MSDTDTDTDKRSVEETFAEERGLDIEVKNEMLDEAIVEINGTQLHIKQDENTPVISELYIETESNPIATINTARKETVTLGGIREGLAEQIKNIKQLPYNKIEDKIDQLAYRLNPTGQEDPQENNN